jgi:hypothetical protein
MTFSRFWKVRKFISLFKKAAFGAACPRKPPYEKNKLLSRQRKCTLKQDNSCFAGYFLPYCLSEYPEFPSLISKWIYH